MTEADYFTALIALLAPKLRKTPTGIASTYEIEEPGQKVFNLRTNGLQTHLGIQLEKLPNGDWVCFKSPHTHAHKKCDCVVVSWDKKADAPKYLLVELKSKHTGTARLQLQASLAFCHFVHRMVCVNTSRVPAAKFAAITVKQFPFSQKLLSHITLPAWDRLPLRSDCQHMTYDRAAGALPVAPIMNQF